MLNNMSLHFHGIRLRIYCLIRNLFWCLKEEYCFLYFDSFVDSSLSPILFEQAPMNRKQRHGTYTVQNVRYLSSKVCFYTWNRTMLFWYSFCVSISECVGELRRLFGSYEFRYYIFNLWRKVYFSSAFLKVRSQSRSSHRKHFERSIRDGNSHILYLPQIWTLLNLPAPIVEVLLNIYSAK